MGIVGAGPVTRAIHLPTLAGLADRFTVRQVMDVEESLAREMAQRAGATAGSDLAQLLADDRVDVVAICSPHRFHAEQIVTACRAGVAAVLCEKPLATTLAEAEEIGRVAAATGTPVVVGAMHAYDPAWLAAAPAWSPLAATATLIRSAIYLPDNEEFIDLAGGPTPAGSCATPAASAALPAERVREAVLGLMTHALPQVRRFVGPGGAPVEVVSARVVEPFGYQVVLAAGERSVELVALMPGRWAPSWTFAAWGATGSVQVRYPPSYVSAGSAVVTVRDGDGERRWHGPDNGYRQEWIEVADLAAGRGTPLIGIEDAIADLTLALHIADGAAALLGSGGGS